MARFTAVYADFSQRLFEVDVLRKQAAKLERSRQSFRHGPEISALCRGAVVLLSSHIEAYVKELGEHTLDSLHSKSVCRSKLAPQFFYHISQEAIGSIRDASQPAMIAQHIQSFVNIEAPFWDSLNPLPAPIPSERFNRGFSNPSFDKVKAYFGRFGYNDFRRDFFRQLNGDAHTIITNLNHIVETRNSIAHGDQSATKTPLEVNSMAETARIFCRTTDTIFGAWCKDTLCSIR
ncbi:MAG: MAE_28990/MAE_18760 family HEPN-like nuclease [Nisaea sp.]|uniref:MAE_28990/MAE_18760 family HEPN-like nuclease n=1 Tax=Alphaproteobacteria TaxID=28211 RepID=UPI00326679F9